MLSIRKSPKILSFGKEFKQAASSNYSKKRKGDKDGDGD